MPMVNRQNTKLTNPPKAAPYPVRPTFAVKLCGPGSRAAADAARRLPRSRREKRRERMSAGVPPANLVC